MQKGGEDLSKVKTATMDVKTASMDDKTTAMIDKTASMNGVFVEDNTINIFSTKWKKSLFLGEKFGYYGISSYLCSVNIEKTWEN